MLNQMFQGIGAAQRGDNQNSPLMDTLAAMNLQQLQDYARKHQDDAATVALVSSIANIKKKTMAAQSRPVDAQQPKIGEQVIAGIAPQQVLPEDQGIGQLPVPSMQKMADGGIVAFGDGGPIPGYADTGLVDQAAVKKAYDEWMASQPSWWQQQTPTSSQRESAAKARYEQLLQQYQTQPNRSQPGGVATLAQTVPTTNAVVVPTADKPAPTVTDTKPTPPTPAPDDKTGAGINPNLPSGPGVGFGASPMQSAGKWYESQLPAKETAQTEEDYLKKRQAVWEPINAKLEGMVESEKKKLKTDKEENIFMSMIQGGLAAAGGSSQYALQNIAQGFGQGAKIYGEGLKDLRQAAKEISKMEMDQQKAAAAQKIGDMDAYEKYSDKVAERNSKIDQLRASGLGAIASATVSGEYHLAGSRESASAYRENAKAYKEAQTEQRDIGLVEQMRKNIDATLKDDPAFKLDAGKRAAEVSRRLQADLKNYPRLLPYAGLPSAGGGGPAALKYNPKTGQIE